LKLIALLLFTFHSFTALALGGKGPMAMNKDGLKNKKPIILDQIGIDEKLGDTINLNLPFIDENQNQVTLQKYFNEKPVFMVLNYYNCPTLCNTHLNQLMRTLKNFEWKLGENFNFVVVSIDPKETAKDAQKKKLELLRSYGDTSFKDNWHFLTGNEMSIKELTSQIGFKYAWDHRQGQWAHAAASYVLTPKGNLSYYHYGIDVDLKVFKLSLVEAASNKIGTIIDRMVLFCLQYDPNKKTYAFYAYNIMKVGALLMALFLGIFLFSFWKKENRTQV